MGVVQLSYVSFVAFIFIDILFFLRVLSVARQASASIRPINTFGVLPPPSLSEKHTHMHMHISFTRIVYANYKIQTLPRTKLTKSRKSAAHHRLSKPLLRNFWLPPPNAIGSNMRCLQFDRSNTFAHIQCMCNMVHVLVEPFYFGVVVAFFYFSSSVHCSNRCFFLLSIVLRLFCTCTNCHLPFVQFY